MSDRDDECMLVMNVSGCSNEWLAWGHFSHGALMAITVLRNLKLSSGHEQSKEDSSHSPTRA